MLLLKILKLAHQGALVNSCLDDQNSGNKKSDFWFA